VNCVTCSKKFIKARLTTGVRLNIMNDLLVAIHNDDNQLIIELLKGLNIDQPLWYGFNALLYAVSLNRLQSARILLEHGADVNYLIDFDVLEDIGAANSEEAEEMLVNDSITEELIDSIQNLGNIAALHIAVKQNNFDMVKLLLEYNALTDIADQGGCTPLHWAVAQNQEAIIALLMRYKADPNILDLAGSSPIDEAKRRNLKDIIQLLTRKSH
jgi:ankyrin repeat protein